MGRPTITTTQVIDGVTVTSTASPWTAEDQALMMARREYRDGIHEACGQPLAISTHPEMEGWYDPDDSLICWACTAMQDPGEDGRRKPVRLPGVVDTNDHVKNPLSPRP